MIWYNEHITRYFEHTIREREPECLDSCEYGESCACLNAYRTQTVCFLTYDDYEEDNWDDCYPQHAAHVEDFIESQQMKQDHGEAVKCFKCGKDTIETDSVGNCEDCSIFIPGLDKVLLGPTQT